MAEAAELVECKSSDSNYLGDLSYESDELDEVIEMIFLCYQRLSLTHLTDCVINLVASAASDSWNNGS